MTSPRSSIASLRNVVNHVAFRALLRSVLVNMVGPAVLYRLAAPHYPAASMVPLAVSALPPILALAFSLIKLRAVDFLGLFALENVLVNVAAMMFAHTQKGALVGRSLQNVPLALIFLGSLAFRKPLVLYMARQLATGNDPASAESFDREALQPRNLKIYRRMTWVWAAGLLIKSAGSVCLALTFVAKDYLIASPLWDLVSDSALVGWSIVYGRNNIGATAAAVDERSVHPDAVLQVKS